MLPVYQTAWSRISRDNTLHISNKITPPSITSICACSSSVRKTNTCSNYFEEWSRLISLTTIGAFCLCLLQNQHQSQYQQWQQAEECSKCAYNVIEVRYVRAVVLGAICIVGAGQTACPPARLPAYVAQTIGAFLCRHVGSLGLCNQ